MIINLLVGGPVCEWPEQLFEDQKAALWVGADRGALRLVKHGIKPALAIGDFDSSSPAERKLVFANSQQVVTAKAQKDDTDTELALKLIFKQFDCERINIYGATGGRLDHFLANLFCVLRPPFDQFLEKIYLYDRFNTVRFFKPGVHWLKKEEDKKYLAFIPLTAVKALELFDEKYRLSQTDFTHPISLASNEFIGETGKFSFSSGVVCVIQSKD
ncbi:thiamine diphosphokinase [Liquorilactobacillus satsumensis]|uniref:thiamine diphosphokinase n=1 Tax=Liquorilactobacillus satsumensis TaxID=259059 RepID=UPI0021C3C34C|nr:thiamine diphosphokinase [Liquorilactobacillus satsumensis]MCP9311832.1 thiamine diphosphokinase [Liquorilactobacillus satsumensis]MCP9358965.1 thiamine diphosphokinase [Liquorilactobacillus satsumensis]